MNPSVQQLNVIYLYHDHTVDLLWSRDCHHVIVADKLVRGKVTDWSSCWTGQGLRESGCPCCECCCCAVGEGRVLVAHQELPETEKE